MDWVYSSPRKFYPLNLKDEVTKGIDKISHLVHFINLRSPVLDRIPLRKWCDSINMTELTNF